MSEETKIYLLIQDVMNGSVTVDTMVTGIKAKDFDEAKAIIKSLEKFKTYEHVRENEKRMSFSVPQPEEGSFTFAVQCSIKDEPLKMLQPNLPTTDNEGV